MTVSTRILNILAALIWYIGVFVLVLKGGSLLAEAAVLRPGLPWPWLALVSAPLLGGIMARSRFARICDENLTRIANLEQPRIWQFFKPSFFLLLALMIVAGGTMSRLASGSYVALLVVATLDLTLAVALLGSSYVFWQRKAFA